MKEEINGHICPVEKAGLLDNSLRRLLQNPKKILRPFIREGMTVVDLGCGPGYFTLEIAKMLNGSGEVIAADLQEGMLEIIRNKIRNTVSGKVVRLHKCGEESTGITTKADFILAFYMIHEVPDKVRLFKELKSIMKVDGRLLIIEPKFHVDRKAFEEMAETLADTGFKIAGRPRVFLSRALVLAHKN